MDALTVGVGVGDRQMPDLAPGGKEGGRERHSENSEENSGFCSCLTVAAGSLCSGLRALLLC